MQKSHRQLILRAACLQLVFLAGCAQAVGIADDEAPTHDNVDAQGSPRDTVIPEPPTGSTMLAGRGRPDTTSPAADGGAPRPASDAGGSSALVPDSGRPVTQSPDAGTVARDAAADAPLRAPDAAAPRAQDAGAASARDAATSPIEGGRAVDANGAPPATTVWRPFSDSSPWNTAIPANATVDPESATLIADLTTQPNADPLWVNIQEYSVPVYWVDSKATPAVKVAVDVGSTGFRASGSTDGTAEGSGLSPIPAGALAAAGTDRHLAIVDRATMTEWGFWDAKQSGSGWTAGVAATIDLKGTGVRPSERLAPWWAGHGPRACGFPLMAGLISPDEIRTGRIEHALVMAYPHVRSRYYTYPASTAQAAFLLATPDRGILCGGHIQLDPTLNLSTLGLSGAGLTIATALQKYGAYVGDYSGAKSIYADASPTAQAYWATGVLTNDAVSRIPLNRFRVLTIGTVHDNGN